MNDFAGMEDLLQDFLIGSFGHAVRRGRQADGSGKVLRNDQKLLNEIFRGFHTIKGGAGFLNANELVTVCHLTENLFDKLRNGEMHLTAELMDVIFSATG